MATIEVKIFAESISDYQAALAQLARSGVPKAAGPAPAAIVAEDAVVEEPINTEAVNDAPTSRGPRRPAKAAASPAPAADPAEPASPAGTDAEAGTAGTGATTSATLADVQAAATKFMAPGVGSQLQAQTLLKEHFKTAAGEPVARFSTLQASDYAACVALFEANTKAA